MARSTEAPELRLTNRKAWHEYEILEKLECGIELTGTEVKAIRAHDVNFGDCFVAFERGQAFVHHLHIGAYQPAGQFSHIPMRRRRLLVKKAEIRKLTQRCLEKGLTMVPLSIYLKGRWMKMEIGMARGKKLHDKRDSLAKKQSEREVRRDFKERLR